MSATKYTYSVLNDFPNGVVESTALSSQIKNSSITRVLDYINTSEDDCDIWFLDTLTSGDTSILDSMVYGHNGNPMPITSAPIMSDGRPIVISNSRPLGYHTMFTMAGDTASGIGDGKLILWDFSNNDDLIASGTAPSGYKGKHIEISFLDPVYIKEGTLYFYNVKKGSYINLDVVCPEGQYYYDRDLNLIQAGNDVIIIRYINKHYFYGDCPMGDELNTESAAEDSLPTNYRLCLDIFVPSVDNDSYGYGEIELYRERTILLPGEEP